jgi:uncharacterized protein YvpB
MEQLKNKVSISDTTNISIMLTLLKKCVRSMRERYRIFLYSFVTSLIGSLLLIYYLLHPSDSAFAQKENPLWKVVQRFHSLDMRTSVLLKVPVINQLPELYNGCEVTSLTMLLNWAGVAVDKVQVADDLPKNPTSRVIDSSGTITYWGDPNKGFVGDITGENPGFGVYHGPIAALLNRYLPGKAIDLTGSSFSDILHYVSIGKPVIVWTTQTFAPTNEWVTWQSPSGPVKTTFDEHCVLLVGYDMDKKVVYINDPMGGIPAKEISLQPFQESWEQLGKQAVSVK